MKSYTCTLLACCHCISNDPLQTLTGNSTFSMKYLIITLEVFRFWYSMLVMATLLRTFYYLDYGEEAISSLLWLLSKGSVQEPLCTSTQLVKQLKNFLKHKKYFSPSFSVTKKVSHYSFAFCTELPLLSASMPFLSALYTLIIINLNSL